MTVAISIKVNDGIVLAADSAQTVAVQSDHGVRVTNVYNNADKVFNLYKGKPIGMITSGIGSIGTSSISYVVKEFREKLTGGDKNFKIQNNYTIQEVAEKAKQFIFDDRYDNFFKEWEKKPNLNFLVAGHSSKEDMAEEYEIKIENNKVIGPRQLRKKHECGIHVTGLPEAVMRLFRGYGSPLPDILLNDFNLEQSKLEEALNILDQKMGVKLISDSMPIQDAIELAEFLVDMTIKFIHFLPEPSTVGGPIDIAAITKFEGFKWIKRKHYYSQKFNCEEKP